MQKNSFKLVLLILFLILTNVVQPQKNEIKIISDPSGAEVFFNNAFVGKTPVTLKNQLPGDYKILVKLDSNNSYSEIIKYKGGKLELFPLFNVEHAILQLNINPADALLFINDSLVNSTTSREYIVQPGLNKIRIEKEDYNKKEIEYNFKKQKYTWNFELTYKYGFINVDDKGLGIYLKVSEQLIENPIVINYKIPVGRLKFEASLYNDKTASAYFDIKPNSNYNLEYRTNYFTPSHIIKSALFPGSGQYLDGSLFKGLGYFIATATSGTLYFIENKNNKDILALYKKAKERYENADIEEQTVKLRVEMENTLNKYNDSVRKKNIFLGLTLGLYLLNLIDAYIFHSEGFDLEIFKINHDVKSLNSSQINIHCPLN